MITDETRAMLEAGAAALVVGFTRADGRPHATRGYGLDLDADGTGAVLLLSVEDAAGAGFRAGDAPDAPIAITGGDVGTLFSAQVKGTLVEVAASGPSDLERKDRYCDEFCDAIGEVDGVPREVAERWRPDDVVRCRIELHEIFAQTPGPGAGESLGRLAT